MQCIQVVLNLLERGERGLAVIGNGRVVLCEGDVGGGAAAAVVKERLRQRGSNGKEAARPPRPEPATKPYPNGYVAP